MSNIVALAFEDKAAAESFRDKLVGLQDSGAIELDDFVLVTVDDKGKAKLHHGASVARGGAVVGGVLGLVVGTLVLAPVAGAALGAAGGAAIGAMTGDYGIDDDFIKKTAESLTPGAAALFVLVTGTNPEAVEAEIRGAHATVMSTTLSPEAEARLKAALADAGGDAPEA